MASGNELPSPDYEGVMIRLAEERSWRFSFCGESIPLEVVFNPSMYAPPLLVWAGQDLAARNIPVDLAVDLCGDPTSLFGAKAVFRADGTVVAQILRIGASAVILEALERADNVIKLDELQYVLGDDFAHYIAPQDPAEAEQ